MYEVLSAVEQIKIFLRMFVTKQFMVAIDFHSMTKNNMLQVNGYHQLWFVSLNKLLKLRIVLYKDS